MTAISDSGQTFQVPHSDEAELALLGALLLPTVGLLERLPEGFAGAEFYHPAHQRIFNAIQEVTAAGHVADAVTVRRHLGEAQLSEIGGPGYLMQLMEGAAPLSTQAQSYAELIRDAATRRAIIEAGRQITALGATAAAGSSSEEMLQLALARIDSLADRASTTAWRSMSEVMQQAVSRARHGKLTGISTGVRALDARINGLRRKTFVVLGGRVKMGKSVAGMSIVRAVADQRPAPDAPKYGVAVFSLEMDEDEIGIRQASDLSYTDTRMRSGRVIDPAYFDAMRGRLDDHQWGWLEGAAASKSDWNVEVDFTPALTPSQIEARCRRLFHAWRKRGVTPYLVLIDHLGLVRPDRKNSARAAERADVIDDIDALKKKLNVCVVGLSQINRAGDGEERPNNTHLEWSDRIAANAQAVVLLYREDYYLLRKPELSLEETERLKAARNQVELIIDIVRGGERGTVKARINLPTASLRDLDEGDQHER